MGELDSSIESESLWGRDEGVIDAPKQTAPVCEHAGPAIEWSCEVITANA